MSTTIAIQNDNSDFIEDSETCICKLDELDDANPYCRYCNGGGIWTAKVSAYTVNLADANFSTLWSALGFDPVMDGSIDPRVLLKALDGLHLDLLRRDHIKVSERRYVFGITKEQGSRYYSILRRIAVEAAKQENKIIWY